VETILIVDDDPDTLRLYNLMLEHQGYRVVAATSGPDAVSLAKSQNPDLILLDLMMPGMDGIEVARQIRLQEAGRRVPIIMLTARSQAEDKLLGYQAGADYYLTKPTPPRELFASLRAALSEASQGTAGASKLAEPGITVGVLGARGGVGASTLALNLGIALRLRAEKPVIVADFRPGQGTIGLELGYLHAEGLARLLRLPPAEINTQVVSAALTAHPSEVRFLLASAQPRDAFLSAEIPAAEALVACLACMAGYAVLDLGASLNPLASALIPHCQALVLAFDPSPHGVLLAKALLEDLPPASSGAWVLPALVSRTCSERLLHTGEAQGILGREVAVRIDADLELASQASQRNIPMISLQPQSQMAQQINLLATMLISAGNGGTQ
jgi:CheY-like chemotaxis protein/MinD-like ATPase involved in chromosome partitioning or flagellar assembly